jgi:hypothetical protein
MPRKNNLLILLKPSGAFVMPVRSLVGHFVKLVRSLVGHFVMLVRSLVGQFVTLVIGLVRRLGLSGGDYLSQPSGAAGKK